jgi:hypothetical protein
MRRSSLRKQQCTTTARRPVNIPSVTEAVEVSLLEQWMTSLQVSRLWLSGRSPPAHGYRPSASSPRISATLSSSSRSRTQAGARRSPAYDLHKTNGRSSSVRRQAWMLPPTAFCANLEPLIAALSACYLCLCPRIVLAKPNVGEHTIRLAQHCESKTHVRCNLCKTSASTPTNTLRRMSTLFEECCECIWV